MAYCTQAQIANRTETTSAWSTNEIVLAIDGITSLIDMLTNRTWELKELGDRIYRPLNNGVCPIDGLLSYSSIKLVSPYDESVVSELSTSSYKKQIYRTNQVNENVIEGITGFFSCDYDLKVVNGQWGITTTPPQITNIAIELVIRLMQKASIGYSDFTTIIETGQQIYMSSLPKSVKMQITGFSRMPFDTAQRIA